MKQIKIETILQVHIVLFIATLLFFLLELFVFKLPIFPLLVRYSVIIVLICIEWFLVQTKFRGLHYNFEARKLYTNKLYTHFFRINFNLESADSNYSAIPRKTDFQTFLDEQISIQHHETICSTIKNYNPKTPPESGLYQSVETENGFNWFLIELIPFIYQNQLAELIVLVSDKTKEEQFKINTMLLEKSHEENMELIQKMTKQLSGYQFVNLFISTYHQKLTEINQDIEKKSELIKSYNQKIAENDLKMKSAIQSIGKIQDHEINIFSLFQHDFNLIRNSFQHLTEKTIEIDKICSRMEIGIENLKKIVEMIISIAEKTKILSINAGIESAHAGQSGQGFKVIASEIKKLSDNTQQSAKSIENEFSKFIAEIRSIVETDKQINTHIENTTGMMGNFVLQIDNSKIELSQVNEQIIVMTSALEESMDYYKNISESIDSIITDLIRDNVNMSSEMTEVKNQIDNVSDTDNTNTGSTIIF